jgi:FdhD protein
MNERVVEVAVRKVHGAGAASAMDALAVEEPLEMRLEHLDGGRRVQRAVAVTMRTPGDDFDLVAGFLFAEGIVRDADAIAGIRHTGDTAGDGEFRSSVVVTLADGADVDFSPLARMGFVSSSCGVCGKTSIDQIRARLPTRRRDSGGMLDAAVVHALPATLRAAQAVFERTGGLHAAALFDRAGTLLLFREDVGRHNAVDKIVGASLRANALPLDDALLFLSGRASFELVQKAAMASIPIVAAVGAPSSLAVELARETNVTLLGFVRDGRFNVYTAPERVREAAS